LDAGSRPALVRADRARLCRTPRGRADPRRDPRQHHPLLGHQHGRLRRAALLGERAHPLQGRGLRPHGLHGLRGGDLACAPNLGRANLSQPDLLPRGRQGRPLRGVGAAPAVLGRGPRGVPIAALALTANPLERRNQMRRMVLLLVAVAMLAGVAIWIFPSSGRAAEEAGPVFVTTIPPGYRDWKVVSVAHEEGDLKDIRAVLGNDLAINAYRGGKLPFPEGAIVGRIAWSHVPSEENNKTFGRDQ